MEAKEYRRVIPPVIFCPRCGDQVSIELMTDTQELKKINEEGYDAGGRGICECGVVCVIMHQPLPKSPTFSVFLDVYGRSSIQVKPLNKLREDA
jgi:hypothetical protein